MDRGPSKLWCSRPREEDRPCSRADPRLPTAPERSLGPHQSATSPKCPHKDAADKGPGTKGRHTEAPVHRAPWSIEGPRVGPGQRPRSIKGYTAAQDHKGPGRERYGEGRSRKRLAVVTRGPLRHPRRQSRRGIQQALAREDLSGTHGPRYTRVGPSTLSKGPRSNAAPVGPVCKGIQSDLLERGASSALARSPLSNRSVFAQNRRPCWRLTRVSRSNIFTMSSSTGGETCFTSCAMPMPAWLGKSKFTCAAPFACSLCSSAGSGVPRT